MEPYSPEREACEEFTRDSLIEISQLDPKNPPRPEIMPNSAGAAAAGMAKRGLGDDGAVEEYISDLISIAYTESPDA
ncbi:hypothetical protein KSP40_PGU004721 [Platanthera guangdongensis]|uniref:Uncharacterized protein n=1 Tax=Platanthera guangdongensis TaxID=2320717 RepID=A0ABR2MLU1_9ASPA